MELLWITGSQSKGNKRGEYQRLEKLHFFPLRKSLKILQLKYLVHTYIGLLHFQWPFKIFPKITPSILYSHKTLKLPVTPIDNETQTWSSLSSYNLLVPLENSKIHDEENFMYGGSAIPLVGSLGEGVYTQ